MKIAIILIIFMTSIFCAEDDKMYKKFWDWFVENEKQYRDFDFKNGDVNLRDILFDELSEKLKVIDKNLTFEFGPISPARDFVLSADGRINTAQHVMKLVDNAPKMTGWKFTKFRQVKVLNDGIIVRGNKLDFKRSKVYLYKYYNDKVGLLFLVPPDSYNDFGALESSIFLSIDGLIGEELAMDLIKDVVVSNNDHGLYGSFMEKAVEIHKLPQVLKEYVKNGKK